MLKASVSIITPSSVQQTKNTSSIIMVFKFILVCASLTIANAGIITSPSAITYTSHGLTAAATPLTLHSSAALTSSYVAPAIATQTYATHPVTTVQTAPLTKLSYSSAPTVSHVYNSAIPALTTYSSPAIGTTHQSTIRSFDGTVSHHSKAVDTAFSSVRKSDTRISNNIYTPIATKTLVSPVVHSVASPLYASTHTISSAPAQLYETKSVAYSAAPTVHEVSAPVYAAKTLTYSAAPLVAHVSFEGHGAHYAW